MPGRPLVMAWGRRFVVVLFGVALVTLVGVVSVGAAPEGARARLRAALERDLRRNPSVPGEALAVDAPHLHLALAVGRADVAGRRPLEATTPFRIASVTKTFVAAAVLRLIERREVRLDDPVAAYLSPASLDVLRGGGYDPDAMTLRQLLVHTAGLFDYAATDAYDHVTETDPGHEWSRDEQLRFAVSHGEPLGAPGSVFHYADTGYVLLGEVLERVTGENLAAAVRELLHFDDLGLRHTYWEKLEAPPAGSGPLAHQYADSFDNAVLDASHDLHGGGGLVSTVADLASFSRALFTGEVFDHPRTLETMREVSGPGADVGAAMGLFELTVAGERCYSHPGYWGTDSSYCPRLDLAFARTINQAADDDFDYRPLERAVVREAKRGRANR